MFFGRKSSSMFAVMLCLFKTFLLGGTEFECYYFPSASLWFILLESER